MPIELTWLVPDTILLSRWIGEIGEEEMLVLIDEMGIILDTTTRPIHTVIDLADVLNISPSAAYCYIQSRIPNHPYRGRVGLVNGTFQTQVLADMLNRISQQELFRFFETRAEARDYFLTHDTRPPRLAGHPDDWLRSEDNSAKK